eukprot:760873-Amphidinium_carterae.1
MRLAETETCGCMAAVRASGNSTLLSALHRSWLRPIMSPTELPTTSAPQSPCGHKAVKRIRGSVGENEATTCLQGHSTAQVAKSNTKK